MKKVIRTSTVPISLDLLLRGQLNFLNKEFEVIALSSPGENLENVKNREGVRVKAINIERKISVFKDFLSLIKLIIYFRQEKPDIVHSITPKAGLLSMLAAFIVGCPIRIHTFTGLIFPTEKGFKKKILILMDKLLCSCATHIFPEGEGVKKDLINNRITNKELKIIGNGNVNGIDLSYFDSQSLNINMSVLENINLADSDFVFVFIGRMVKDKGLQELVNSFDDLSKQYNCCKLILVGDYESSDPLNSKTIKIIENNKSIISVGFQKDIRPFLKRANVFVLPSYREGFPNSLLQAGAMGVPSIVTDVNGSNEIILNEYNGLIIEKQSEIELLNAMKRVIRGEINLDQMGINANSEIRLKFDRNLVWNELLREYNKYL